MLLKKYCTGYHVPRTCLEMMLQSRVTVAVTLDVIFEADLWGLTSLIRASEALERT